MAINAGTSLIRNGLVLHLDSSDSENYVLNKVEVLVVAGGGGGGYYAAGAGGGGGGILYSSNYQVTPGSAISVTVGNGGNGGVYSSTNAQNGQNSVFGVLTSIGGGAGGAGWSGAAGGAGGCGGGGAGYDGTQGTFTVAGGSGTLGQGFAGGFGRGISGNRGAGGGGGGAGGPGGNSTTFSSGNGGSGLPFSISGSLSYYSGGGGGGDYGSDNGGSGGLGGGGRRSGGNSSSQLAGNGKANTGGGGGGSKSATSDSWNGGNGGSGIVIVRYSGPQKATGGNTITQVGGYTIHTFTSSGTFTPLAVPANDGAVYGLQDLSGNNNSGIAVNGPTYNSANGGSIVFDGVNDYVNIGIGKGVNQFSGDFAVSAWVFRNAGGPNFGNVIGDYYTGSVATTNEWQLMMSSTAQFNLYRVGSNYVIPNTASGYSASQWINIVVSRIGSTISMYANNNLIASTTNSEVFGTATGNLNIGIDGNNSSEPLSARISNIMIYKNKGLTTAEVSQNFNALRGRFGI